MKYCRIKEILNDKGIMKEDEESSTSSRVTVKPSKYRALFKEEYKIWYELKSGETEEQLTKKIYNWDQYIFLNPNILKDDWTRDEGT